MPRAVEEMLRWGSPISSFMRTATRDTEVRGTRIREGDRLLMLYASANRDETVFGDDAEGFRVGATRAATSRSASASTSASAPQLARMEARVAFGEILWRCARIELAGEPEAMPSLLVRGVVRLPVAFAR